MSHPRGSRTCAKESAQPEAGGGRKSSPSWWPPGCPGGDTGTGPPAHQGQLSQQDAPVPEPWGGEMGVGVRSGRTRYPTRGCPSNPFPLHRYWLWFSEKWSPHLRQWHHGVRSYFAVWRRKPSFFLTCYWAPCCGTALEGETGHPLYLLLWMTVIPWAHLKKIISGLPCSQAARPHPQVPPAPLWSPSQPDPPPLSLASQAHLSPQSLWNPTLLFSAPPNLDFPSRLQPLPTILPSIYQLHPASPKGSSLLELSHTLGLPTGKVSAGPLGPVFPAVPCPR